MVTFSLRTVFDSQEVYIDFDQDFRDLFDIILMIITARIEGLKQEEYSFRLFTTETPRSYKLFFAFNISITKTPLLAVFLNIPLSLSNHPTKRLTKTSASIRMKSYFQLLDNNIQAIETTQIVTENARSVSNTVVLASSLSSAGSSLAIRGLMLMELIRSLRF